MAIWQTRSVAVVVSDEKLAKEWYKDKLALEVQSYEEHWVVVAPRCSSIGLNLCPDKSLKLRNTEILLFTTDTEGTCKELKSKGVEFTTNLGNSKRDEAANHAIFKNPDENVFILVPK